MDLQTAKRESRKRWRAHIEAMRQEVEESYEDFADADRSGVVENALMKDWSLDLSDTGITASIPTHTTTLLGKPEDSLLPRLKKPLNSKKSVTDLNANLKSTSSIASSMVESLTNQLAEFKVAYNELLEENVSIGRYDTLSRMGECAARITSLMETVKQLKRSKDTLEKAARAAEVIPSKREREQLDLLRLKIADLQTTLKRAEQRASTAEQRHKNRVEELTKQNGDLMLEVRILEQERATLAAAAAASAAEPGAAVKAKKSRVTQRTSLDQLQPKSTQLRAKDADQESKVGSTVPPVWKSLKDENVRTSNSNIQKSAKLQQAKPLPPLLGAKKASTLNMHEQAQTESQIPKGHMTSPPSKPESKNLVRSSASESASTKTQNQIREEPVPVNDDGIIVQRYELPRNGCGKGNTAFDRFAPARTALDSLQEMLDISGPYKETKTTDKLMREFFEDRIILSWYTNTTMKEKHLDTGVTKVYLKNGDYKMEMKGGQSVYWHAESKILHKFFEDGTEVIDFKESNQVEVRYADGRKEIRFADGTIRLAGGDKEWCAILVAVNALIQLASFGPVAYFLTVVIGGGGESVALGGAGIWLVVRSVLVFLGAPLAAGKLTRLLLRFVLQKHLGKEWYDEKFMGFLAPQSLVGLLYTVLIMFIMQSHVSCQLVLSEITAQLAVTQSFTAAGNNFELAIAVAVATFGIESREAFAAVIGPLIEVPMLLSLVYVAIWWKVVTRDAAPVSNPTSQIVLVLECIGTGALFDQKRLNLSSIVRIGRKVNAKTAPDSTNGIFDSKVLSRTHAEIWAEGNEVQKKSLLPSQSHTHSLSNQVFIRDVKSSNGTFINGFRLSEEGQASDPHPIHSGDFLDFGIDIMNDDGMTVMYYKVSAKATVWRPSDGSLPAPPPAVTAPPNGKLSASSSSVEVHRKIANMDPVISMLDDEIRKAVAANQQLSKLRSEVSEIDTLVAATSTAINNTFNPPSSPNDANPYPATIVRSVKFEKNSMPRETVSNGGAGQEKQDAVLEQQKQQITVLETKITTLNEELASVQAKLAESVRAMKETRELSQPIYKDNEELKKKRQEAEAELSLRRREYEAHIAELNQKLAAKMQECDDLDAKNSVQKIDMLEMQEKHEAVLHASRTALSEVTQKLAIKEEEYKELDEKQQVLIANGLATANAQTLHLESLESEVQSLKTTIESLESKLQDKDRSHAVALKEAETVHARRVQEIESALSNARETHSQNESSKVVELTRSFEAQKQVMEAAKLERDQAVIQLKKELDEMSANYRSQLTAAQDEAAKAKKDLTNLDQTVAALRKEIRQLSEKAQNSDKAALLEVELSTMKATERERSQSFDKERQTLMKEIADLKSEKRKLSAGVVSSPGSPSAAHDETSKKEGARQRKKGANVSQPSSAIPEKEPLEQIQVVVKEQPANIAQQARIVSVLTSRFSQSDPQLTLYLFM
ncbi:hypothetical protein HDU81_006048 [Chytriomyces hyalinus]|nr:hypothetical protein HDU81_006048 [Chytriomyces hyalinus]